MDPERIAIAKACLNAAYDGSLSFPEIVGRLAGSGFEGYAVDYRLNSQAYYLPDGDSIELDMPHSAGKVAAEFASGSVEALVRWAQTGSPEYNYTAFCEKIKAAGCAGYLVSLLGQRVVYYGRTAEVHVELFPQ